ncbi:hypothetical protein [Agaribacter flavus]|uniref:Bacteriocin n=1 Tax=Agaribacter flavus TaxID=1902781 RepID=A0ABV7FMA3_9ALTE
MYYLNKNEAKEVNGGNPLAIGIGIGIGANYAYDSLGGKEGIDNAIGAIGDFFYEALTEDPVFGRFFD